MTKRTLALSVLLLTLALPSLAPAKDRGRNNDKAWIHVEVTEDGNEEASVKVNLPLSMARMALEMAPEDVLHEGHIQIDNADISVDQLREMWKELREAGDGDFVTVKDGDETVRVFRRGNMIHVQVNEKGDKENVQAQIPVALVDALLSGDGDELDIEAALAELENLDHGDIVRVQDGGDLVRVWID